MPEPALIRLYMYATRRLSALFGVWTGTPLPFKGRSMPRSVASSLCERYGRACSVFKFSLGGVRVYRKTRLAGVAPKSALPGKRNACTEYHEGKQAALVLFVAGGFHPPANGMLRHYKDIHILWRFSLYPGVKTTGEG